MKKRIITSLSIGLFVLSSAALHAADGSEEIEDIKKITHSADMSKEIDASSKIDELKKKLKGKFRSDPTSIKESKLPNIYEVMYGTEVVYFSVDGKYFIAGDMIDLETRSNLSDVAKESVRNDMMTKVDYKPVVFKAKDEKHKLTVFTDIDCGYCAKLHREMADINSKGITVEYLMFPRAGLKSKSYEKAVSMWCSDDQHTAMTDAKERREISSKTCDNPVSDQYLLGQQVGVTGTPALVTSAGKLIPGYMPADRLLALLDAETK